MQTGQFRISYETATTKCSSAPEKITTILENARRLAVAQMHRRTRVLKLVIEGIAKISLRTRRATYYLLKEPELVKTVLKSSVLKK